MGLTRLQDRQDGLHTIPMSSLGQQFNDMAHVVDSIFSGASLDRVQSHPVVHLHPCAQSRRLNLGVDVALPLNVGNVESDTFQFLIANLTITEGRHLESRGADLAFDLCLGVARNGRSNR